MKIKVKQVLLGILLLNSIIVSAQKEDFIRSSREYPLGTYYGDVPKNSYIRDMKGELKPFVGVYKATYKGRETTLYITEEKRKYIDLGDGIKYYEDKLIVKFIVKDTNGKILQDTQSGITKGNEIESISFTLKNRAKISFSYTGTNCSAGWGYMDLELLGNGKLKWSYYSNGVVITEERCPGNPDLNVYLPDTLGLIFTKQ